MNGTDKERWAENCSHPAASMLLKPFLSRAGTYGKNYASYGEDLGGKLTVVRPLPEAAA